MHLDAKFALRASFPPLPGIDCADRKYWKRVRDPHYGICFSFQNVTNSSVPYVVKKTGGSGSK